MHPTVSGDMPAATAAVGPDAFTAVADDALSTTSACGEFSDDLDVEGLLTTAAGDALRCLRLQPNDGDDDGFSVTTALSPVTIIIAIVLSAVIVGTVIGNSCVILSVVAFDKMRTMSNGLIASLASADLLVAVVVLPLSLQVSRSVQSDRVNSFHSGSSGELPGRQVYR
jgi:hypothetical protein